MNERNISRQIAEEVLDNLTEGCQVIGFDFTYLYANDMALRHGQSTREILLGRTMMECYPGVEATPMFAAVSRCMTSRAPDRMENEFRFPNGSIGWFELRFIPVPQGVCVLSLDITERKRASDALQKIDERLRLLIDGVRDYAMIVLDPAGKIVLWNTGAERLLGYTTSEILGEDMSRFRGSDEDARRAAAAELENALRAGRWEEEGHRVRRDGVKIWTNVVVTPLYDEAGVHRGFAKIIRDLTEHRRLEEQLRQSQKMEAIGSLAGGIAHDFNNLLSVILSYSILAVQELREGDPIRADIEEIHRAAERAAELTRQLLAFSRRQVQELRAVDLNHILSGMEKLLHRILGEDVELSVLASRRIGMIRADPTQIEQIIMNLMINARDAMPEGGRITVETSNIELTDEYAASHVDVVPGPYVLLAVTDTGTGMDEDTKKHIFEPFFSTKGPGKGTGLGLSTVFGIVKQSRGHIWVYSELGRGTTFKIYLPEAAPGDDTDQSTPREAVPVHGNETILLVEDEDQVRALARTILRRHGYHVLEAKNGGEAFLISEQFEAKIHLLLTDVVMPRMSGRQVAERLRRERPDMRVLYMSGYTSDAVIHHGILDAGIVLLQKPITPTNLLRKVRDVLSAPRI